MKQSYEYIYEKIEKKGDVNMKVELFVNTDHILYTISFTSLKLKSERQSI